MVRGLAVASVAVPGLPAGADAAPATSDITFGDALDPVENIAGGTGGQVAVGAAPAGTAIV
jgi:hypothetical protein